MKLAVVYGENKGGLPPQKKEQNYVTRHSDRCGIPGRRGIDDDQEDPYSAGASFDGCRHLHHRRCADVRQNADGAEIGWLTTVFEAGTVRMGSAIMATIFGAWLGQLMNKTGVTENIIKKSAELGGDRPLVVTLIMVVATAVLFTTLSGLGSIIMVGSIVLPSSSLLVCPLQAQPASS